MSEENVEIVRQGFAHFLETGQVPWVIFDEAIEVHDHDTPDQDVYRGHAGYARYLADWGAAWSTWTLDLEEFIDAGDSVVAVIRMKARGQSSGIEIDRQDALVYKLRAGKLVRLDYYNDRAQALKSVGLEGRRCRRRTPTPFERSIRYWNGGGRSIPTGYRRVIALGLIHVRGRVSEIELDQPGRVGGDFGGIIGSRGHAFTWTQLTPSRPWRRRSRRCRGVTPEAMGSRGTKRGLA